MEIRLVDSIWLIALLALPLAGASMFWLERRFAPSLRYPRLASLLKIPGSSGQGPLFVSNVLKLLVLALVVVALARPQWVKSHDKVFAEGIDIVLALDISTSMNAADFQPRDRITVEKQVVSEFIAGRKNDRIGVVVFAKEAYTQAPLTLDYKALLQVISTLRTGAVEDGTAIGNAVATAANRLRDAGKSRVIVLITDGDNNSGNISPAEAAELASKHGIKIFTIIVGKEGPVPFPVGKDMLGRTSYQNVEFTVNPKLMKEIAARSGGKAYTAENGEELKLDLQKILNEMEKSRFAETSTYERAVELAPHLLFLALLLMLADFLLSITAARRWPS
ncbi:MAG: VWA domain-containing protein [Myxococcota bacterium]|jgi:Ca-activated chloride channel family protein